MIIAVLLIFSSGGLQLYNYLDDKRVEENNLKVVTEIENILEDKEDEEDSDDLEYITVDGVDYIGIIYIPSLDNLSLPVIKECTYPNLKISICKYSGSLEENNLVIAGHRYNSSLGNLEDLTGNVSVYYKTVNGNVYKYKLSYIDYLYPSQVSEMVSDGDWDLTLFTCNYGGTKRIAYRLELDM